MSERNEYEFATLTSSQLSQLEITEKELNSGSNEKIIVLAYHKA